MKKYIFGLVFIVSLFIISPIVALAATYNYTLPVEPSYYSLTVNVVNTGKDTISSSPAGITNCTGSCSAKFISGTKVTLYATASQSAYFAGFGADCTGNEIGYVTMTSNKTCSATFHISPISQAPIVATTAATNITTSKAALNGTIDNRNLKSETWFEWGTSSNSLINKTEIVPQSASTLPYGYQQFIGPLQSNTVYYFRLVGKNISGTTYGNVLKFITLISTPTSTSTSDLTPRISFWLGKVNQHVDVATKQWLTDPDAISGADLDKLKYCQKWYPSTISAQEYKTETINSWRDRGNLNSYASSRMSIKCVQRDINTSNYINQAGELAYKAAALVPQLGLSIADQAQATSYINSFLNIIGWSKGLAPSTGTSTYEAGTSSFSGGAYGQTTSSGYYFAIGSTGPAVIAAQNALIAKGCLKLPLGVSVGYWGSLSATAAANCR